MYLRPVLVGHARVNQDRSKNLFKQPYTEGKWKVKCATGLSGKEKLGYGKKRMGTSRKQEVGRDKQEEKRGRFVGAKCMQEEERSDTTLARKHLHV